MEAPIPLAGTAAIHVREEVKKAYADCWMSDSDGMKIRNLNFQASAPVSQAEAYRILSEAIPDGYNEFRAELVLKFPTSAMFIIARAGSVCLFVKGIGLPGRKALKADEYDYIVDGWIRIWWD